MLYEPSTRIEDPPPSLGRRLDYYLLTHGYQSAAIWTIHQIAMTSMDCDQFVNALCSRGMTRLEASWMWDLVQENPDLNKGQC